MAGEPHRKSRRTLRVVALMVAGWALFVAAVHVAHRSLLLALVLYVAGAACGLAAAIWPTRTSTPPSKETATDD